MTEKIQKAIDKIDQEAEKIFCPSSSSDTLAMRAIRSAILRSRTVQVGDLNMTVSDTMAAAMRLLLDLLFMARLRRRWTSFFPS